MKKSIFYRALTRMLWRCGRRRRWLCWLKRGLVLFLCLTVVPVAALRWVSPPTSSVMVQRALQGQAWPQYHWVSLETIAPSAALAVVAAEDQKFPQHRGFDLDAIEAAWRHNAEGGALRGASTITQQVAKNLFLWEGRSWTRKGLEAWFAVLLESLWPKARILEVYLNIAETGDGTFGFEAAAQRFFAVSAENLASDQSALIAAALSSPRGERYVSPHVRLLRKRDWVLQQMRQLGGPGYLDGILP